MDDGVTAIVLACNAGPLLARCVSGLTQFFPKDRILVGDNGSSDGSIEALDPDIRVEKFGSNLGYCAGINRLFRIAQDSGARIVLSVNPDAAIKEEDVNRLIESLKDADVAVAHPRILREREPGILDGAWGEITWRHFAVRMLGEGEPDGPPWDKRRLVPFGHGACFAANLSACLEVGGFDEEFFAYQDEAELALRLKARGYLVSYVGTAKAIHRGPGGEPEKTALKKYFLARNSVLLVRKHGNARQKLKFALMLAAGFLLYVFPSLTGDVPSRRALVGWYDGLLNRRSYPKPLKGGK